MDPRSIFPLSLWPNGAESITLDSGRDWGVFVTMTFLKNSYMGWKVCLNSPTRTHTSTHTHSCNRRLEGEQGIDGRRKWVIQVHMYVGREQASCHGLEEEVTERRKMVKEKLKEDRSEKRHILYNVGTFLTQGKSNLGSPFINSVTLNKLVRLI